MIDDVQGVLGHFLEEEELVTDVTNTLAFEGELDHLAPDGAHALGEGNDLDVGVLLGPDHYVDALAAEAFQYHEF